MLDVQIQIDEASLKEAQQVLRAIPRAFPRVLSRSLNRTITHARVQIARSFAKNVKIKAKVGDIKSFLYIHHANTSNLRAGIEVSKFGYPLIELQPERTAEGVTYKPSFSKKRELRRHAFIATGEERGRQVWIRARYYMGRRKYIEWRGRIMEAIFVLKEPSLYYLMDRYKVIEPVKKGISQELNKNVNAYIGLELKKWSNK